MKIIDTESPTVIIWGTIGKFIKVLGSTDLEAVDDQGHPKDLQGVPYQAVVHQDQGQVGQRHVHPVGRRGEHRPPQALDGIQAVAMDTPVDAGASVHQPLVSQLLMPRT